MKKEKENIDIIFKELKKKERSTTEISNIIGRNHYDTLSILEELEKDKKIEKIEVGKFTFWKINENGKKAKHGDNKN